jgi:hypothetical protein
MRRVVLATVALVGCGFDHGHATDSTDGGGPPPDSSTGGGDGSGTTTRQCHSSLPGLRLCLDFEPPDLEADASGLSYSIASQLVTATTRGTQGAAQMTTASLITIDDSPNLLISPALAIELWIDPTSLPEEGVTGLVSKLGDYGIGLSGDRVTCNVSSKPGPGERTASVTSSAHVPKDTWTHVACVYDGARLAVYVGGDVSGCTSLALTLDKTVHTGATLAGGYAGALDDVHVYAQALPDADVCRLATGTTSCKTSCL